MQKKVHREGKSYLLPRPTSTKHRETDTGNKKMVVNQCKTTCHNKSVKATKLYIDGNRLLFLMTLTSDEIKFHIYH